MKAIRYLWALLLFLLVAPGEVLAQLDVETRVQELEESIRVLENRVDSLEVRLLEQSAPASIAPGKVNWRKLQIGMPEGDVEKLLGSPVKVEANPIFTIWHYGDRSGGQVQFDTRSHKVSGWNEP